MTFAPLLAATPAIQLHAFAAIAAFALGIVQLTTPKGTIPHRLFGWLWAGLMLAVALSSFFIHTIRLWGPFSPIHLLSVFTLIMLPLAVLRARRHRCERHRRAMLGPVRRRSGDRRHFTFFPAASCMRCVRSWPLGCGAGRFGSIGPA